MYILINGYREYILIIGLPWENQVDYLKEFSGTRTFMDYLQDGPLMVDRGVWLCLGKQ